MKIANLKNYRIKGIFTLIYRGLRKRCPRCGQGRLYRRWYRLNESCEVCELRLLKDAIDILAFMYLSTVIFTGFFIVGMFWVIPQDQWWGRIVLGVLALLVMVGSLPYRKGVAIALDFWSEHKINQENP